MRLSSSINLLARIQNGQKKHGVVLGGKYMLEHLNINYEVTKYDNKGMKDLFEKCITHKNKINIFGGDHSLSIATLGASLYKTNGDVKVVWVDAHADMNTPYTSPSGNRHGMPVAHSLGLFKSGLIPENIPLLKPSNLYYIGLRDLDPFEIDFISMNNIKVFTVDQANNDPQSVYEEINQNKLPTHFSFDIDSVDPKFVSSTGTPVKNGLTVQSAKELVRYFTEDNKTMLKEFVEVNPCLGNYEKSYDIITEILDEIYLD